ncbi:MAG: ABC transporter permease [Oscillospiraceae bacterium]|nr:ABC transporter permease [Oscillospiraceae bacterium]
MRFLAEGVKMSYKRMKLYRINIISWVIADISLYASIIFMYIILVNKVKVIGDYRGNEILLFVSCYLLINNIFAICANSVTAYCRNIIDGKFNHDLLRPKNPIIYIILKNINLAPLLTTLLLVVFNLYCIRINEAQISLLYFVSVVIGAITMMLLYLILYTFALFKLKIDSVDRVLYQIVAISEMPDTIFPKTIRNILIYAIPVYLFSSIPARISLGKSTLIEEIWTFVAPVLLFLILRWIYKIGLRHYSEGLS